MQKPPQSRFPSQFASSFRVDKSDRYNILGIPLQLGNYSLFILYVLGDLCGFMDELPDLLYAYIIIAAYGIFSPDIFCSSLY